MDRIYQPIVIERVKQILYFLNESGFFKEFEITDTEFSKNYLSDVLTNKLIDGKIDMEFDEMFSEGEFDKILKELIAGSVLTDLKQKGMLDSYEDEDTEERFFLTEKGMKYMEEIKKNEGLV